MVQKHRKRSSAPVACSPPTHFLDLTGKSTRKPPPLQPHQAYSVIHFRPDQSPLREEVQDLWDRRDDEDVKKMLSSFVVNEGQNNKRILFHNTVMRWKCSLLSQDEQRELQEWIKDDERKRWDAIRYPWRALQTTDVSEMTAENQHIQR